MDEVEEEEDTFGDSREEFENFGPPMMPGQVPRHPNVWTRPEQDYDTSKGVRTDPRMSHLSVSK
jgi:hypothetical protein